jgi:hypothetical protein
MPNENRTNQKDSANSAKQRRNQNTSKLDRRTPKQLRDQKRASRKRLGSDADKPSVIDINNLSPKLAWCPTCEPLQKLVRKNISLTHAIKACHKCKRKMTFIRTDTPQGRSLRMKIWRERTALGLTSKDDKVEFEDGKVIDV